MTGVFILLGARFKNSHVLQEKVKYHDVICESPLFNVCSHESSSSIDSFPDNEKKLSCVAC